MVPASFSFRELDGTEKNAYNSQSKEAERPRAQGESPCVRKVRAPQGEDSG